jgi:hypothetical protein
MLGGYLNVLNSLASLKRKGVASVETVGVPFKKAREEWVERQKQLGR